jgi:DNA-binding transcriptional LysR family regulator
MFKKYTYFLAVARYLSLKQAATQLGISQPTLSLSISNLEKEIGVKLFHRRSKGVELTEYGEALVEHATTVQAESAQFRNHIQRLQLRELGQIKLGVGEAWWECFVKQTIYSFRERYPDALFHFQFGNNLRLFELLLEGEIDLFIGHEIDMDALSYDVKFTPLFTDSEWLYVSQEHLLVNEQTVSDFPLLAVTPYMSKHSLRGVKQKRILSHQVQYEIDSLYASLDIVLHSDAVMPYTDKMAQWLEQRGLRAVVPTHPKTGIVGVYWRADSMTGVTRSLMSELENASHRFIEQV